MFIVILTIYATCLAQWPGEEACYVGDECTQFTTEAWDRKGAQAETSGGGNLRNSCYNFRRRFHILRGGGCVNSSVTHPSFFYITREIKNVGGVVFLKLCKVCSYVREQWKWTAPQGKVSWEPGVTASQARTETLQPVSRVSQYLNKKSRAGLVKVIKFSQRPSDHYRSL